MKKYILSLVALLTLVSGNVYATQGEGSGGPNVKRETGAVGFLPYKEYQLVRYGEMSANSVTLSLGDVVVWNCVSDDGVTIGLASAAMSADAVAGVVVSTVINTAESTGLTPGTDYGRRNWGYIQVVGLSSTVNITSGGAAGSALRASDTPRYAEAMTVGSTRTQRAMGFAYDASAQGQGEAYVDL